MAPSPREVVRFIARNTKRLAISIVGFALVALGLVMMVLPGPGILFIVLGFAVLGTEYAWAAAALERTKRVSAQAGRTARDRASRALRRGRRSGP